MGFAKRELERLEIEKWSEQDSKNLCRSCLEYGDDFEEFFSDTGHRAKCDYCKRVKTVVEINALVEFISSVVRSFYVDPAECLPYETAEGGYHGASVYDTEELLDDLIQFNAMSVRDDIVGAFEDASWCEKDPFGERDGDTLRYSWDKFSRIIKYERRYFFPRPKKRRIAKIRANGPEYPGDILNAIINISKHLNIFSEIKKGKRIYRCRKFSSNEKILKDLKNIGVPESEVSLKFANRLSPAGIPIFYGAFTKKHLTKEIRSQSTDVVVFGEFIVNQDVLVMDLTKIPNIPSLFSKSEESTRQAIIFLNHFKQEIMVPVEHNGCEHVEYVPSQVFSEFIRYRCTVNKQKILGIVYPSIFSKKDKNIALFISNDSILDGQQNVGKNSVLRFVRAKL